MGGHKEANPKTGGKGRLSRGDKKQRDIFGRKGIDKKQRERGPLSQKIEKKKKDVVVINDEQFKFLYVLSQRWAFGHNKAVSLDDLCRPRGINEEEHMIRFYKDLKSTLRKMEKSWLRQVEGEGITAKSKIFFNPDRTDEIRSYLENYKDIYML